MADIVTRSPFDVLAQTRQFLSQMDEMVGRAFAPEDTMFEGTLPLDIYETADELVVEVSVPGFTKDEIGVQVHQGVLSIVARNANAAMDRPALRYYRRERPTGAWARRVALPGIVHDAEVRAELKDGVLKLHIPIPETARPRQVVIDG